MLIVAQRLIGISYIKKNGTAPKTKKYCPNPIDPIHKAGLAKDIKCQKTNIDYQ